MQIQIKGEPVARLKKQADAVGAQTVNQWAAMILTTVAGLDPSEALKLMGKIKEISTREKRNRPRISDL